MSALSVWEVAGGPRVTFRKLPNNEQVVGLVFDNVAGSSPR